MQQLTINLIPLEINNAIVQCSFYTEKLEKFISITQKRITLLIMG